MRNLNLETKLGRVVRELHRAADNGRHADIDSLQQRLGSRLTRKEITSYASKLYNQGYLQRLGQGKYRATEKLSQLTGGTEAKEPSAKPAEDSGKSPTTAFSCQVWCRKSGYRN